jgi:hypothetical protein
MSDSLATRESKRRWTFLHKEQVAAANKRWRALFPDKLRRQARERMKRFRARHNPKKKNHAK